MATGEIRLSILWEWLHKSAAFTEADAATGVKAGDRFTLQLFRRLLEEEHQKLLIARDKDVHASSKFTTLPIALAIVEAYVLRDVKAPWYVDLLNLNLGNVDLPTAVQRIRAYLDQLEQIHTRTTHNLDFRKDGTDFLKNSIA